MKGDQSSKIWKLESLWTSNTSQLKTPQNPNPKLARGKEEHSVYIIEFTLRNN